MSSTRHAFKLDLIQNRQELFFQPSEQNKKIACSSHRKMDMKAIAEHLLTELR